MLSNVKVLSCKNPRQHSAWNVTKIRRGDLHNITKTNQSQVRRTEVGGAAESPFTAPEESSVCSAQPTLHRLRNGEGLSWHRWQSCSRG